MASSVSKIYNKEIIAHILGSILFLTVPFMMGPDGMHGFSEIRTNPNLRREFIGFVLLLIFFYSNYFVLMPKFFFSKKYLLFVLVIVAIYFLIFFIPQLLVPITDRVPPGFQEHRNLPLHPRKPPPFFDMRLVHNFFIFLAVGFFSIMLKFNNKLKEAEKEKISSELMYLKAQINPHFLFNTLNSIYSLAIEKSDYTATAVVKLSRMMRYVISETDHDFVSLEKEIDYLSDYVELQRIRLDDATNIIYEITGEVTGKKIAPLILIPFVENAFKFGVNPEMNSKILIRIEILDKALVLNVKNNKVSIPPDQVMKSGLGIENVKARLQLLYPGKYALLFRENEIDFTVSLNINLE